jgi:hypothetical protein
MLSVCAHVYGQDSRVSERTVLEVQLYHHAALHSWLLVAYLLNRSRELRMPVSLVPSQRSRHSD